jgi:diaminopimelate epimerase
MTGAIKFSKNQAKRPVIKASEKTDGSTRIPFTKMVAAGNDFIVIDNRDNLLSQVIGQFAVVMCDRRSGIGADGLILIEGTDKADIKMRIINPDGREAEMCGNGARCVALYAQNNHLAGKTMTIDTMAGAIEAHVGTKGVILIMGKPTDMQLGLKIKNKDVVLEVHSINTGVPHAVMFVDSVEKAPVLEIGRYLRHHAKFNPKGTNVDFVALEGKGTIRVRTYERGVENETLACGTGIVASALIAAAVRGYKSPMFVKTQGREQLVVTFEKADPFENVRLEGPASFVYSGSMPVSL